MIVPREYLIPLLNSMVRSGERDLSVYEGHRGIGPILSCSISGGRFPLSVIDRGDYEKHLVGNIEELHYKDMITLIVKGSGFYPHQEIGPILEEYGSMVEGRMVARGDRPVWLFFDTCAIMNNISYVLRKAIKGELVRTTTMGVQNEIEEKMDMRFKSRDDLDRYREVFGESIDEYFNQPFKVGRIARLSYPELDRMRIDLGRDLIEDHEVGDTAILNGFRKESRRMNVDGIVVSSDRIMVERALEHGMRGWFLPPTQVFPRELTIKMSDLALMIYRASVLYGKVRLNDSVIVKGIWHGKEGSDWKQEKVWVEGPYEKGILKLRELVEGMI